MATVFLVGVGEPQRTVLVDTLKRAGHAVLEAADAAAAIALATASTPDLVVTSPVGADADAIARLADALPNRAQALRDHEDDVDFAMSVARIGVSYRPLDSPDVFISRSLGTLMGLPRGTVQISRDELLRHVHPDDVARVRGAVDDAIAGGSEFQVEYRWHSAEEGWRWFRSHGRVSTGRAAQSARLFTSIADVTERRSLELQLQQIQKMEAIGQLAGGVAHDFNNLLTAIGGYAGLLLETAEHEAQRHDLEEILKAARRAAALTKQLLAFSRRQQMEPAIVDLNGLIEDMAAVLRRIIGENIDLTTRLTADGASVRADRDQLEQVVMNLVINAREATGSHGVIRLETAVVTLGAEAGGLRLEAPPGTYVMFSVIDTGHGMTEDTKARLFEPFFTTKPPGQGTGLGLATVYGIIAQSGGSIEVTSEPGAGSAFTVYMPKQQRTPPAARQAEGIPPLGGGATILLAEDEAPIRALARVILERAGYTVVEAANPAEAQLRSESMPRIDLLLTDVVMPGGTGPELFRLLSEGRPSMRVLFMSGYAEQDVFERAAVAPEGAFLPKPFSKQQLIGRVREALDK